MNSTNSNVTTSLKNFLKQRSTQPHYAVCLTYYNESLKDIYGTLESISHGLPTLNKINTELKLTVYLIMDGAHAADPNIMALANGVDETNRFQSDQASYRKTTYTDTFNNISKNFDLIFVIKHSNKGKLNSHKLFFEEICTRVNPEICMQIDSGTVLTKDCLAHLYKTLEDEQLNNVGVGAGMCIEDRDRQDMLYSFQAGEFLLQRGIYWSAECFFGYLSVMPGQCSVVRWSSLIERDESGSTPLERYLMPEEQFSAIDKLAYLAEDRVMGLELFSNGKHKNTISYEPNAVAYTDPCDSFEELLKQRRRWINSAFTCRILMILFFIKSLFATDIPIIRKLKSLPYIAYASVICLSEILLPAIFFSVSAAGYQALPTIVPLESWPFGSFSLPFAYVVFWALHAIAFSPLVLGVLGAARNVSRSHINISLVSASCIFLINLMLYYFSSIQDIKFQSSASALNIIVWGFSLVGMPLILTLGLVASSGTTEIKWLKKTKVIVNYLSTLLFMYLTLYVYAIVNIADTSWGTKGLKKDAFAINNNEEKTTKLRMYQYIFWFVYIAINTSVLASGFNTFFNYVVCICIFMLGVYHSTKLKRSSMHRHWSAQKGSDQLLDR